MGFLGFDGCFDRFKCGFPFGFGGCGCGEERCEKRRCCDFDRFKCRRHRDCDCD